VLGLPTRAARDEWMLAVQLVLRNANAAAGACIIAPAPQPAAGGSGLDPEDVTMEGPVVKRGQWNPALKHRCTPIQESPPGAQLHHHAL
jgi:hypothetical protein